MVGLEDFANLLRRHFLGGIVCANGSESSSLGHTGNACASNENVAADELKVESTVDVALSFETLFCSLPDLDPLPCRSFGVLIGRFGKKFRSQARVAMSALEL